MKRTIVLFVLVISLVAGWSAAWFFVEGKVIETAERVVERMALRGQYLNCTRRKTGGYPFRISFICGSLEYRNTESGVSLETGELRSAAQAYQPGKLVVEVDSPAVVSLPRGQSFDVTWRSMRSSLVARSGGVDRFSLVGTEVELSPMPVNGEKTAIRKMQFHGRRMEGETVQLAVKSERITSSAERWPTFDANILLSLEDAYAALLRRPDLVALGRTNGLKGELQVLEYRPLSGGSLMLSGPVSVSRDGLVSGDFELRIAEASQLLSALNAVFPEYEEPLQQLSEALSLLPPSPEDNLIAVPLTAREGRLFVGLLPVGILPPIY